MKKRLLTYTAVPLIALSVGITAHSSVSDVVSCEDISDPTVARVVTRAPSADSQKQRDLGKKFAFATQNKIEHEIYRINLHIPDAVPEFNFSYSIEFPSLRQQQFDLLMKRFGGQSQVPWQKGKRYTLLDFLPAKIQSLVNHTLEQKYVEFEVPDSWRNPMRPPTGEPEEYETGMACWDAAYEVVRDLGKAFVPGQSEVNFFHIGAPIVDAVLKNPSYSVASAKKSLSFQAITPGDAGRAERNQGRQLGDVLLVNTMANMDQGAAHAMVWLDDDLFFEKPDMGSGDPFRIVFYEDGMRYWLTDIALETDNRSQLSATFYRYNGNLPDPKLFTGKSFEYNWSKGGQASGDLSAEPLPSELAKKFIWNQDVGLGGGLSKYRINPVLTYQLTTDKNGRAKIEVPGNVPAFTPWFND